MILFFLANLIFDLYDVDKSCVIEGTEIENMLLDLYGTKYKDSLHAQR
jgi:hypothetical protein